VGRPIALARWMRSHDDIDEQAGRRADYGAPWRSRENDAPGRLSRSSFTELGHQHYGATSLNCAIGSANNGLSRDALHRAEPPSVPALAGRQCAGGAAWRTGISATTKASTTDSVGSDGSRACGRPASRCSTAQPLVEVSATAVNHACRAPRRHHRLPFWIGGVRPSKAASATRQLLRPSTAGWPRRGWRNQRARLIVGVDQSTNLFSFRDRCPRTAGSTSTFSARVWPATSLGDPTRWSSGC